MTAREDAPRAGKGERLAAPPVTSGALFHIMMKLTEPRPGNLQLLRRTDVASGLTAPNRAARDRRRAVLGSWVRKEVNVGEYASDSEHLEGPEKDRAEEHAPLRPVVIHEILRAEGKEELGRPSSALLWSGLAAGLSMGFSFVTQALLTTDLAAGAGGRALASIGYMVGFAIVVLGRQQLFTESTLTAVLPALDDGNGKTWASTLRLWGIVLLANLAGTWMFSAMLVWGHPLPPSTLASLAALASEPMANPFWNTLLRSILAGWLIALMVWLLPSAGSAKIVIIGLVTWLVAFAKLSHIVAGSAEAAYGVLTGQATFLAYLIKFAAPTLIGNTLGGVALVAMLNHAPVSADAQNKDREPAHG